MAELLDTLRGWLTIRDAAAQLSKGSGKTVTEAQVLLLGLEGHLTLSVNFVNDVAGTLGSFVPRTEPAQVVVVTLDNNELVEVPRCTINSMVHPTSSYPPSPRKSSWSTGSGIYLLLTLIMAGPRQLLAGRRRSRGAPGRSLDELRRIPSLWDTEQPTPPALEPPEVHIDAQSWETKEGRRKAVKAFLDNCNRTTPFNFGKHHIWKVAGYKSPSQFQAWHRADGPPRESATCAREIRSILALSPKEFVTQLRKKRFLPNE